MATVDQPGVAECVVGDANDGDVIKVATGTYTDVHFRAGITQVVYISKTITVQGGYTITNWSNSDPISYPTTFDAEGRGRGMVITGPITVTVERLRITGGDATGLSGDPKCCPGGGIYATTAAVTIGNSRVFSNTAYLGGGLFVWNLASFTLAANKVYSNASATNGGGMLLAECANAMLTGNQMTNNFIVGNSAGDGNNARDRGAGMVMDSGKLATPHHCHSPPQHFRGQR